MHINNRFVVSIVLCVLLCGCSHTNCVDDGTCECVTRYDCKADQLCVEKKCIDRDTTPWIVATRKFGEACIGNSECVDGYCLPLGPSNGGVCTRPCDAEATCDEGWECLAWTHTKPSNAPDDVHVCVQNTGSRLCMNCTIDGHCNATGDLCVEFDEVRFCAKDCSNGTCPKGYECQPYTRDGETYQQCIPVGNSCECGLATEGMGIACTRENEHGVCAGWSFCNNDNGRYVQSACDAREPAPEMCNGIDDDCDGLTDVFDPSLVPDEGMLAEDFPICRMGGCVGKWQCRTSGDVTAWTCDAGDPEREVCNGQDDNCDGRIDETFTDADGHYVDLQNCGACGADCHQMVAHLAKNADGSVRDDAVMCEWHADEGTSRCRPIACEPGYYPYPHEAPVTCVKLESPACQACSEDSDCQVYSDRCIALQNDYGRYCLQSCAPLSPYEGCRGAIGQQDCCPSGYTCQNVFGDLLCMPGGETCTCDVSKLGMTRNCVATTTTDVCQGRQTCEKISQTSYSWSVCDASTLNEEVCDGQDNDCDGEVDEEFRDDKGRYNHVLHCGACYEDCDSRWKAKEMHATGDCILNEEETYVCQFMGCKKESLVVGKRCSDDGDCAATEKCDQQHYFCIAREGEMTARKCSKNADCQSLSMSHQCVSGECRVEVQFHNVNGIDADGCECGEAVKAGEDVPDTFDAFPDVEAHYADRNCDGIDGDLSTSLFVNAQSTHSSGTREAPYRTIMEAVKAFDASKHSAILVAVGTYREQVVIGSGIKLYGGYASDFSSRNIVLHPTQIEAPYVKGSKHQGSLVVTSSQQETVVNGFRIKGYDVTETSETGVVGTNAYAVVIENGSNKLSLSNNEIFAGTGGQGGRGKSGESGANGGNGENGHESFECNTAYCDGVSMIGGKGGVNASCKSANGNSGRTAYGGVQSGSVSYGIDGSDGSSSTYRHAEPGQELYCKYDCTVGGYANGGNGQNGNVGEFGKGGSGCWEKEGSIVDGYWVASDGMDGRSGSAGSAGGGGGAGGGAVNTNAGTGCTIGNPWGDVGGSGGGGGAGGCGGTFGYSGSGGGGSFGIWIVSESSSSKIGANIIHLGTGGDGGAGGAGGAGGIGGKGGLGGAATATAWCGGDGGSGGVGGDGGAGGGGGGGCGGNAYGIAGISIRVEEYEANNTFTLPNGSEEFAVGKGGIGGHSPSGKTGAMGGTGNDGIARFVYSF